MTLSAKTVKRTNINVPIKTQQEQKPSNKKSNNTGKLNVKNKEMLAKLTGGGFVKLT